MPDVVVTVPTRLWDEWLDEGDLPGEEWSGNEYHFYLGGAVPSIAPKERVYIVAHGKLRGYAPLCYVEETGRNRYALVRHGGAVAVTITEPIQGFRGFRYRWWRRQDERPFPDWRQP